MDVLDTRPDDWTDTLSDCYSDVLDNTGDWAKKCVEEFGADLICVKFDGIHPDKDDKDASHAVQITEQVLGAVGVPLVLWGCGNDEKDNQVMPKVSQAAKGENCLVASATEKNYRTLAAIGTAVTNHFDSTIQLAIYMNCCKFACRVEPSDRLAVCWLVRHVATLGGVVGQVVQL